MSERTWNPRFTLYAKSRGLDEQAALDADRAENPGASMLNFMQWISRAHRAHEAADSPATFDGWLEQNYASVGGRP